MIEFDIVVIGSGIAGASAAALIAETHSVALIERESQPGYHSTGRSAALFSEIYGNDIIRALSRASREFLTNPPEEFSSTPLVRPRGSLFIATAEQLQSLRAFAESPDIASATTYLSPEDARILCPALREDYVAGAVYEPDSADIEVSSLHHGYLRLFRRRGGRIFNGAPVHCLRHDGHKWTITAGSETLRAGVVVNASGAWADEIAMLAGIRPIGLQPCRRTAVLIDPPSDMSIQGWPMVLDIDEQFYFKPDAAQLLLSPADESPTPAGDAQPEEWDVAVAIDRIEAAATLQIRRLGRRWAGLRTFAADRTPVVGYAGDGQGFFWLAGQGGYGIQTSPSMARAAAALVRGLDLPEDLRRLGIGADDLSPSRFAQHG